MCLCLIQCYFHCQPLTYYFLNSRRAGAGKGKFLTREMVLQWQALKPEGKKSLRFKPLSLNLGYNNLGYQKMAVICSSVQETATALLVMLLMPLNGCIYVSILATLLKQNPISPPLVMIHNIKHVQTTQIFIFQVYWKMFSLLQEVHRT